jgi:Protein of unknown function (DUF3180)
MGPTRKRDLTAAVVGAAVVGYVLVITLYRWLPPITVWTGLSLLGVAIAEALWARHVRAKINDGEIGAGPGWLHPLAGWYSVGGSGYWCTSCRGGPGCGSPPRTPPGRRWPPSARWR